MGCLVSKESTSVQKTESNKNNNNNIDVNQTKETNVHKENGEINKPSSASSNSRKRSAKVQPLQLQNNLDLPVLPPCKPIAFNVSLDGQNHIDSQLLKPPPKKIQMLLEPISNLPKLTAEQLEIKQRQADKKRLEQLEKIKSKSRKTSKKRMALQQAKEFESKQTASQKQQELENKLRLAERNKELRNKKAEKIRLEKEEKARKVREKALLVKQNGDLDCEIENDENFNKDDDDESWTGDGDDKFDTSERIYSGRESPQKQFHKRGSAEVRARMSGISASTTDSFDNAYQRRPPTGTAHGRQQNDEEEDDFFN